MSDNSRDDIDLATAAEQSSEVEENQEGDVETSEGRSVESAEERAISVEDEDDESLGLSDGPDDGTVDASIDEALTALQESRDPEADAVVDDALDVDTLDEAEAAVEAVEDEEETELEDATAAEANETIAADEALDAEDDDTEVDPYEAFKAELRMKPGKWYVIHSYAGFERRVKSNIENRMVSMSMEDSIYQVEVPMEDVVEIKNGQRKLVTRVRIPSYVLVRMDLNEDSWSVVRHTPGVTGFVGNAHNPTPLRFDEAFGMLKSLVQVAEAAPTKGGAKGSGFAQAQPQAEVDFEIGETITIKEGSFAGLPGSISEIKPESGKLTVLVSLFERETPVELSFDQVTKL